MYSPNTEVLILGWKKKDLVIVSPITFLSSANCILQSGATPHFVDINMQDYSFDLIKLETEIIKLIKKRKRPKAVIVTDYAGHPADWIKLKKLKNQYYNNNLNWILIHHS